MKFIYLFAFLFAFASANIGVDVTNYQVPSRSFFDCLAGKNVSLTILQILDERGNVNTNFLKSYIASKDAKIKYFDALVTVSDSFEPSDVCSQVAQALPTSFNGTVWLDVENKQSYWSRNVSERIPFLENITTVCKDQGIKVGIYSSSQDWASVFGSQGAGSDILKAVPVWYQNDNQNADFDDFEYAGFGTWETPQMKKYQGDMICNFYATSINYFEAASSEHLRKIHM